MGVRCHPKNAKCLCVSCHEWWHSNPLLAAEWMKSIMGEQEYYKLLRMAKAVSKMTVFEKDFIRKEQSDYVKAVESGETKPVMFVEMFRKT